MVGPRVPSQPALALLGLSSWATASWERRLSHNGSTPLPPVTLLDMASSRVFADGMLSAALSATQAYWSSSDWSLWRNKSDADRLVENDLEALLYVAVAVLSFKANGSAGRHWLSWGADEWEKAADMLPNTFKAKLGSSTNLDKEAIDMLGTWKKHVAGFRASKATVLIYHEADDPEAQEALQKARRTMMQEINLCVSSAAAKALEAEVVV